MKNKITTPDADHLQRHEMAQADLLRVRATNERLAAIRAANAAVDFILPTATAPSSTVATPIDTTANTWDDMP